MAQLELAAMTGSNMGLTAQHDLDILDAENEVAPAAEMSLLATQPQVRDPERFTGHRVRLRVFEGPLDLLLYLIRAHRYDIFDIPISDVTHQFIEFIRLMEEIDLEYAGDFMVT